MMMPTLAPFWFAEQLHHRDLVAVGQVKPHSVHDQPIPQAIFLEELFYRTSNPKDSVFALHEIIPDLANVEPDYSSTPGQIFSAATEAILRTTPAGLKELRQWLHPQASPQLPSWVFDFTHCRFRFNENGHKRWHNQEVMILSDAAAGSSFHVVRCNKTSIHVAGFVFDEILDISGSPDRTELPQRRWRTQVRS
jgi:hypothetical protein